MTQSPAAFLQPPQHTILIYRLFSKIIAVVVAALTITMLTGCSNNSSQSSSAPDTLSLVVLHGLYVEGQTGQNKALDFASNGVDFYINQRTDPNSGQPVGDCLAQNMQYQLVGNTVRVSGGTLTQEGQSLSMFSPSSGGSVILLQLVNSGQELDFTDNDGAIVKYIRQ